MTQAEIVVENLSRRVASRAKLLTALAILATGGSATVAMAQTAIPPKPKDFAMQASQSDYYEIEAARAAAAESKNPDVRKFAEEMISDHTHALDNLRDAVKSAGLQSPEPGMSRDQAALLNSLQSTWGSDFDQAYVRQQVLAHTQAAAVTESFAEGGEDQNLKKAAQSSLPMIRQHLKMAENLKADVGGLSQ